MTTEEMFLQLIEGQKQMSADISNLKEGQKQMSKDIIDMKKDITDIKEDIAEIKEEAIITRSALNRQGDMLDQLIDFVNDFLPVEFKYDPNK